MNQVELRFIFDGPKEAAKFLEGFNSDGEDWPSGTVTHARKPHEDEPPWDEPESDAKASADPWADDATTSKPSKPQRSSETHTHPDAGKLFPASGTYPKAVPSDSTRSWDFGVAGAPDCDCGYPAALVTGHKGNKKWQAYWCPIGFTKDWKNKCGFSEFA